MLKVRSVVQFYASQVGLWTVFFIFLVITVEKIRLDLPEDGMVESDRLGNETLGFKFVKLSI
jgi:hypothetical protein